jgi:hypothetical protein
MESNSRFDYLPSLFKWNRAAQVLYTVIMKAEQAEWLYELKKKELRH